jgi:hypothetical protein
MAASVDNLYRCRMLPLCPSIIYCFLLNTVACRPVARQRPVNCYWLLPLPWVNWIQSTCSHLSFMMRFNIIPPYMLTFPKHLVSYFRVSRLKSCKPIHFSPPRACGISYPSHPPWFDHRNITSWRKQSMKFLIMLLPPCSLTSSPLCPHIVLSDTPYFCSSFTMTEHVSHESNI